MSEQNSAIVLSEMRAISKELAPSSFLPQALRGKPAEVLMIVLTGKELGLEPTQALRGIHIIQGKPTLSADLLGALVMKSPVCEYLTVTFTSDTKATYKAKRKGAPDAVEMSFSWEDAQKAFLTDKDNWKKHPAAMLRARCLSSIARAVFPDVCMGIYDSDSGELTNGESTTPAASADLKAQIKAAVVTGRIDSSKPNTANAPKQTPVGEVVEGEVVESTKTIIGGLKVAVDADAKELNPRPPTFSDRINAAKSLEELKALVPELKKLPLEEQKALRPVFDAKKAELS